MRPEPVVSFRAVSDKGSIPVTICACGVLVLASMTGHYATCEVLAEKKEEMLEQATS